MVKHVSSVYLSGNYGGCGGVNQNAVEFNFGSILVFCKNRFLQLGCVQKILIFQNFTRKLLLYLTFVYDRPFDAACVAGLEDRSWWLECDLYGLTVKVALFQGP
jgi:hypothetical protein